MAIAIVQTKSGAGHSLTLTSATTAGNCIVVGYGATNSATSTTACTLGGAAGHFAKAAEIFDGIVSLISLWADPNCAGGQTAIAITPSPSGALDTIWAIEVSGLVLTSPVDKTSTNSTAQASWTSGTTTTTTQAVELWVGALSNNSSTPAGPAGWTNTAVSNAGQYLYGYKIVSSAGAAVYSGTGGDTSDLAAAVITLKGLSGIKTLLIGGFPV